MSDLELTPTLWRTCRVLAGPTRLRLLGRILRSPDLTVSDLAALEGLSLPRASQELRRIHSRGLVQVSRVGRKVRYRPTPDPRVPMAKPVLEAMKIALRTRSYKVITECVRIASAFSHLRRLSIIQALMQGPQPFDKLAATVGFSSLAINRHLRILKTTGTIEYKKHSYRLIPTPHPLSRCLLHLLKNTTTEPR